ncbi:unnamed protein product [Vitrella brassicaformis CCMP3155]|uniref:Vacuolar protein 8 n=4 Tax=Vitrella brassicaformis TaxID=1169539 RepID=A0A0G4F0R1_VITBC|nr:unnamed protein product [Vitrella brassicaformis CCMP3155]|eukprot:CEM05206.1 unnamed protein product [Vitrella brassicaformis CCMP3155]
MAALGELIKVLRSEQNFKEKRGAIRAFAAACGEQENQLRILNTPHWFQALLPQLLSLDIEAKRYGALAVANLSSHKQTHEGLLKQDLMPHLVSLLIDSEDPHTTSHLLTALGNLTATPAFWPRFYDLKVLQIALSRVMRPTGNDPSVASAALFLLANLTCDGTQRRMMLDESIHEYIFPYMTAHASAAQRLQALTVIRGVTEDESAQELLPQYGVIPLLLQAFTLGTQGLSHIDTPSAQQGKEPTEASGGGGGMDDGQFMRTLIELVLGILHNLSLHAANSRLLLADAQSIELLEAAGLSEEEEFTTYACSTIANMCEDTDLHTPISNSRLLHVLREHFFTDDLPIRAHVTRAVRNLCMTPRLHPMILQLQPVASLLMMADLGDLDESVRVNALMIVAALAATHPTCLGRSELDDLVRLACDGYCEPGQPDDVPTDVRRYAMMALANVSSDTSETTDQQQRQGDYYFQDRPLLAKLLSKMDDTEGVDGLYVDYLAQLLHNCCLVESARTTLHQLSIEQRLLNPNLMDRMSSQAASYTSDICRRLSGVAESRARICDMRLFSTIHTSWRDYLGLREVATRLALLCSTLTYYDDTIHEFVLQNGVYLVALLYDKVPTDEYIRVCCLLTFLYISKDPAAQRAIAAEDGLPVLLDACRQPTSAHTANQQLISNALKTLLPFAQAEQYRGQLALLGSIDVCSFFLYSPELELRQLGLYLLQNLLEDPTGRRIFLQIHPEVRPEDDYIPALVNLLPGYSGSGSGTAVAGAGGEGGDDSFVGRCVIHCLASLTLEHHFPTNHKLVDLHVPHHLFSLFFTQQIDKDGGEAVVRFFAEICHMRAVQVSLLRSMDVISILLQAYLCSFPPRICARAASALLALSRSKSLRSFFVPHMNSISEWAHLALSGGGGGGEGQSDNNEETISVSFSSLFCELSLSGDKDCIDALRDVSIMDTLMLYLSAALQHTKQSGVHGSSSLTSSRGMGGTYVGRGASHPPLVELLLPSVTAICALCISPLGDEFLKALLFPPTRLQLFLSILNLRDNDVDSSFCRGSARIAILHRTANPELTVDDLNLAEIATVSSNQGLRDSTSTTDDAASMIYDRLGLVPSSILCRQVFQTLCVGLSSEAVRMPLLSQLKVVSLLPFCATACSSPDSQLTLFAFAFIALLSMDGASRAALTSTAGLMNDLLSYCRRFDTHFHPQQLFRRYAAVAEEHKGRSRKYKGGAADDMPTSLAATSTTSLYSPEMLGFHKYVIGLYTAGNLAEDLLFRYPVDGSRIRPVARKGLGVRSEKGGKDEDFDEPLHWRLYKEKLKAKERGAVKLAIEIEEDQEDHDLDEDSAQLGQSDDSLLKEQLRQTGGSDPAMGSDEHDFGVTRSVVSGGDVSQLTETTLLRATLKAGLDKTGGSTSSQYKDPTSPGLTKSSTNYIAQLLLQSLTRLDFGLLLTTVEKKRHEIANAAKTGTPKGLRKGLFYLREEEEDVPDIGHLLNAMHEFVATIHLVIVHNSLINPSSPEAMIAGAAAAPASLSGGFSSLDKSKDLSVSSGPKSVKSLHDLHIPEPLRALDVKKLRKKVEEMISVVCRCLEYGIGLDITRCIIEALNRLTFFLPSVVRPGLHGSVLALLRTRHAFLNPASICSLLANACADTDDRLEKLAEADTDFLRSFILCDNSSARRYLLGAVANWSTRDNLRHAVIRAGGLDACRPAESRDALISNFAEALEKVRILANLGRTKSIEVYQDMTKEAVVAFLGEVFQVSYAALLHKHEAGVRLRLAEQSRQYADDSRPPTERDGGDASPKSPKNVDEAADVETEHDFRSVAPQSSPPRYAEALHLSLACLHNLLRVREVHEAILKHPSVVDTLLALAEGPLPLTPSTLRLVFASLVALCYHQNLAGRVFAAMSTSYGATTRVDFELERLLILAANMHYLGTDVDHIKADKSLFMTLSNLSVGQQNLTVKRTIAQILHRISMAPVSVRKEFLTRDSLLVLRSLFAAKGLFEVQIRAFEAAYFLTVGALDVQLWSDMDVLPHMFFGALHFSKEAATTSTAHDAVVDDDRRPGEGDSDEDDNDSEEMSAEDMEEVKNLQKEALWEVFFRTAAFVAKEEPLVIQLSKLSSLDHILLGLFDGGEFVDLFNAGTHCMCSFLNSSAAHIFWARWCSSGLLQKLKQEVQRRLEDEEEQGSPEQPDDTEDEEGYDRRGSVISHPASLAPSVVSSLANKSPAPRGPQPKPAFHPIHGHRASVEKRTHFALPDENKNEEESAERARAGMRKRRMSRYDTRLTMISESEDGEDQEEKLDKSSATISRAGTFKSMKSMGRSTTKSLGLTLSSIRREATKGDLPGKRKSSLSITSVMSYVSLSPTKRMKRGAMQRSTTTPLGLSLVAPPTPHEDSFLRLLLFASEDPASVTFVLEDVFIDYLKSQLMQLSRFYDTNRRRERRPVALSIAYRREDSSTSEDSQDEDFAKAAVSFKLIARVIMNLSTDPRNIPLMGMMGVIDAIGSVVAAPGGASVRVHALALLVILSASTELAPRLINCQPLVRQLSLFRGTQASDFNLPPRDAKRLKLCLAALHDRLAKSPQSRPPVIDWFGVAVIRLALQADLPDCTLVCLRNVCQISNDSEAILEKGFEAPAFWPFLLALCKLMRTRVDDPATPLALVDALRLANALEEMVSQLTAHKLLLNHIAMRILTKGVSKISIIRTNLQPWINLQSLIDRIEGVLPGETSDPSRHSLVIYHESAIGAVMGYHLTHRAVSEVAMGLQLFVSFLFQSHITATIARGTAEDLPKSALHDEVNISHTGRLVELLARHLFPSLFVERASGEADGQQRADAPSPRLSPFDILEKGSGESSPASPGSSTSPMMAATRLDLAVKASCNHAMVSHLLVAVTRFIRSMTAFPAKTSPFNKLVASWRFRCLVKGCLLAALQLLFESYDARKSKGFRAKEAALLRSILDGAPAAEAPTEKDRRKSSLRRIADVGLGLHIIFENLLASMTYFILSNDKYYYMKATPVERTEPSGLLSPDTSPVQRDQRRATARLSNFVHRMGMPLLALWVGMKTEGEDDELLSWVEGVEAHQWLPKIVELLMHDSEGRFDRSNIPNASGLLGEAVRFLSATSAVYLHLPPDKVPQQCVVRQLSLREVSGRMFIATILSEMSLSAEPYAVETVRTASELVGALVHYQEAALQHDQDSCRLLTTLQKSLYGGVASSAKLVEEQGISHRQAGSIVLSSMRSLAQLARLYHFFPNFSRRVLQRGISAVTSTILSNKALGECPYESLEVVSASQQLFTNLAQTALSRIREEAGRNAKAVPWQLLGDETVQLSDLLNCGSMTVGRAFAVSDLHAEYVVKKWGIGSAFLQLVESVISAVDVSAESTEDESALKSFSVNQDFWSQVDCRAFESSLVAVHKIEVAASGLLFCERTALILFHLIRTSFPFKRRYFPDMFVTGSTARVAPKGIRPDDRRGETVESEATSKVLSSCCAILSTASAAATMEQDQPKGIGRDVSTGKLMGTDMRDSLQSIISLSDHHHEAAIWQLRSLAVQSRALDTTDQLPYLDRTIDLLLKALETKGLSRYAIVILHNFAVRYPATFLFKEGTIRSICHFYERMARALRGGWEERLCQRLALSTIRLLYLYWAESPTTLVTEETSLMDVLKDRQEQQRSPFVSDWSYVLDLTAQGGSKPMALHTGDASVFVSVFWAVCRRSEEAFVSALVSHNGCLNFLWRCLIQAEGLGADIVGRMRRGSSGTRIVSDHQLPYDVDIDMLDSRAAKPIPPEQDRAVESQHLTKKRHEKAAEYCFVAAANALCLIFSHRPHRHSSSELDTLVTQEATSLHTRCFQEFLSSLSQRLEANNRVERLLSERVIQAAGQILSSAMRQLSGGGQAKVNDTIASIVPGLTTSRTPSIRALGVGLAYRSGFWKSLTVAQELLKQEQFKEQPEIAARLLAQLLTTTNDTLKPYHQTQALRALCTLLKMRKLSRDTVEEVAKCNPVLAGSSHLLRLLLDEERLLFADYVGALGDVLHISTVVGRTVASLLSFALKRDDALRDTGVWASADVLEVCVRTAVKLMPFQPAKAMRLLVLLFASPHCGSYARQVALVAGVASDACSSLERSLKAQTELRRAKTESASSLSLSVWGDASEENRDWAAEIRWSLALSLLLYYGADEDSKLENEVASIAERDVDAEDFGTLRRLRLKVDEVTEDSLLREHDERLMELLVGHVELMTSRHCDEGLLWECSATAGLVAAMASKGGSAEATAVPVLTNTLLAVMMSQQTEDVMVIGAIALSSVVHLSLKAVSMPMYHPKLLEGYKDGPSPLRQAIIQLSGLGDGCFPLEMEYPSVGLQCSLNLLFGLMTSREAVADIQSSDTELLTWLQDAQPAGIEKNEESVELDSERIQKRSRLLGLQWLQIVVAVCYFARQKIVHHHLMLVNRACEVATNITVVNTPEGGSSDENGCGAILLVSLECLSLLLWSLYPSVNLPSFQPIKAVYRHLALLTAGAAVSVAARRVAIDALCACLEYERADAFAEAVDTSAGQDTRGLRWTVVLPFLADAAATLSKHSDKGLSLSAMRLAVTTIGMAARGDPGDDNTSGTAYSLLLRRLVPVLLEIMEAPSSPSDSVIGACEAFVDVTKPRSPEYRADPAVLSCLLQQPTLGAFLSLPLDAGLGGRVESCCGEWLELYGVPRRKLEGIVVACQKSPLLALLRLTRESSSRHLAEDMGWVFLGMLQAADMPQDMGTESSASDIFRLLLEIVPAASPLAFQLALALRDMLDRGHKDVLARFVAVGPTAAQWLDDVLRLTKKDSGARRTGEASLLLLKLIYTLAFFFPTMRDILAQHPSLHDTLALVLQDIKDITNDQNGIRGGCLVLMARLLAMLCQPSVASDSGQDDTSTKGMVSLLVTALGLDRPGDRAGDDGASVLCEKVTVTALAQQMRENHTARHALVKAPFMKMLPNMLLSHADRHRPGDSPSPPQSSDALLELFLLGLSSEGPREASTLLIADTPHEEGSGDIQGLEIQPNMIQALIRVLGRSDGSHIVRHGWRILATLVQIRSCWKFMYLHANRESSCSCLRRGVQLLSSSADKDVHVNVLRCLSACAAHALFIAVAPQHVVLEGPERQPSFVAVDAERHYTGHTQSAPRDEHQSSAVDFFSRDVLLDILRSAGGLPDCLSKVLACWTFGIIITSAGSSTPPRNGVEQAPLRSTSWLRDEGSHLTTLVSLATSLLKETTDTAVKVGSFVSSLCLRFFPLEAVLPEMVPSLAIPEILSCLSLPYPSLHFFMLLLLNMLALIKMPLSAKVDAKVTKTLDRLFSHLFAIMLEHSDSRDAEDEERPKALVLRWLCLTRSAPLGAHLRSLAICVLGANCARAFPHDSKDGPGTEESSGQALPRPPARLLNILAQLLVELQIAQRIAASGHSGREYICRLMQSAEQSGGLPGRGSQRDHQANMDAVEAWCGLSARPELLMGTACHLAFAAAHLAVAHPGTATRCLALRSAAFTELNRSRVISTGARVLKPTASTAYEVVAQQALLRCALVTLDAAMTSAAEETGVSVGGAGASSEALSYLVQHIQACYVPYKAIESAQERGVQGWQLEALKATPTRAVTKLLLCLASDDKAMALLREVGGADALFLVARHAGDAEMRRLATVQLMRMAESVVAASAGGNGNGKVTSTSLVKPGRSRSVLSLSLRDQ